jgi:putative oxidoreductase
MAAPAGPRPLAVDLALLLLRLSGGLMIANHGWGKLVRMAAGDTGFVTGVQQMGFPFPAVFAWAATLAETLGALFVLMGLFTKAAAAAGAFGMFVAAFLRHKAHLHAMAGLGLAQYPPDTVKGWGNPELALMYLLVFLALALAGGGRFAVERFFGRKR